MAFAALTASGTALAGPGEHIRTGNAVITPYIGLYGTYRSNVFLQEGIAGGGDPVQNGVFLDITPGIDLKIESDDLDLGLGFEYRPRKYLNEKALSLDRGKDMTANFSLRALPHAVVGLNIVDQFSISSRATEAVAAENANLTHTRNDALAQVMVQPGSSLEVGVGADFNYEDYNVPKSLNVQGIPNLNTRTEYGPVLGLKWNFLPKTALMADFSYGWFNWSNNFVDLRDQSDLEAVGPYGDFLGKPDGTTWRATAGLRGRFTAKTVVGIELGYGQLMGDDQSVIADATNEVDPGSEELDPVIAGFGEDLTGIQGLLASVDLEYSITENQKLLIGYSKDFQDPYFANFVAYNSFFARYNGRFAKRVDAKLGAQLRLEDYGGETYRADTFIRLDAGTAYHATDYLEVSAGVGWMRRANSNGGKVAARNPAQEYDNVDVGVGLLFTY